MIEEGALDRLVRERAPELVLLSEAERTASLQATLAARPSGPVWLFAYGSLIWNPAIDCAERRVATVHGWHRSFCLSVSAGRGTVERPGLTLGLKQGGQCTGVALRIPEATLVEELSVLWRREMLTGAYVPRWVDLDGPADAPLDKGLAFTIDPGGAHYAGDLPYEEVVDRLAHASGFLGSAADYLFRTCEGLRDHAVQDPELEALASDVLLALT